MYDVWYASDDENESVLFHVVSEPSHQLHIPYETTLKLLFQASQTSPKWSNYQATAESEGWCRSEFVGRTPLCCPLHPGLRWAGIQRGICPGQPMASLCRRSWPAGQGPRTGCPLPLAGRSPPALRLQPGEEPYGTHTHHNQSSIRVRAWLCCECGSACFSSLYSS